MLIIHRELLDSHLAENFSISRWCIYRDLFASQKPTVELSHETGDNGKPVGREH